MKRSNFEATIFELEKEFQTVRRKPMRNGHVEKFIARLIKLGYQNPDQSVREVLELVSGLTIQQGLYKAKFVNVPLFGILTGLTGKQKTKLSDVCYLKALLQTDFYPIGSFYEGRIKDGTFFVSCGVTKQFVAACGTFQIWKSKSLGSLVQAALMSDTVKSQMQRYHWKVVESNASSDWQNYPIAGILDDVEVFDPEYFSPQRLEDFLSQKEFESTFDWCVFTKNFP